MTTLLDRIRIWASAGTKTAPSTAKIDLGWVGGEQPPHEWENERMNARDTQLVGCVDAVNDSPAGGRTLYRDRNVAACIPENIGLPYSADNHFDAGDGLINGACLYEYDGTKQLIFPHVPSAGTSYIKVYDINTKANTNQAFPGDLVLDVCSTGRYIYILYADVNGANYDYSLTAIDGSDWTTKTGWPGTDPQLGSEPVADIDGRPFCRVTPLGDILCGGRWYGAIGDDKLAVIDATAGTVTQSGDAGLGATLYPSGDCVVVGGTIFYAGLIESTGSMFVASLDETDLSTGTVEATYGVPTVAGELLSLCSLGDHILVGRKTGANAEINMYDESFAPPTATSTVTNSDAILGSMIFDGVNVWILFFVAVGTNYGTVLRKFNFWSMSSDSGAIDIDFTVDEDLNHFLGPGGEFNTELGYMRPPLVFDGCGVWASPYATSGSDFSGEWFRLSNVYAR